MNETANAITTMTRTVDIDLHRDWIEHCKHQLVAGGWTLPPGSPSDEEIAFAYLNVARRIIPACPRAILKSATFSNPSAPNLQAGLVEIERKILAGDDLRAHLSRKLRKTDYNDSMLNDWGVQHLHLSDALGTKGFVTPTGPLLFARFDDATAYFIDVLHHGDWSRQSIVQVLHDNWPDSIEPFRLKGATAVSKSYSDDEIAQLREGHVNAMVQVSDGTIYAPLGGGYAVNGLSSQVVMQGHRCASRLRELSRHVIDNIEQVVTGARNQGIEIPAKTKFALSLPHLENGEVCAIEVQTKVGVKLGLL